MQESTRNLIIGIIVVVVVVAVVGFLAVQKGSQSGPVQTNSQSVQTAQGVQVVPGTSAVATSGQVVTPQGKPVELNVQPGAPTAPQESASVAVKSLPPDVVKITATAAGYSPDTFTVQSGHPVTLAVTAGDNRSYVFAFSDPSLSAVAIGVGPGDPTHAITFNAPAPGKYAFVCNMPNCSIHGTMIVQ